MMHNPGPRMRTASPLSMQSNDSNFLGQYQNMGGMGLGAGMGAGGGDPYSAANAGSAGTSVTIAPPNTSPQHSHFGGSSNGFISRSGPVPPSQRSPPISQHPSGSTDASLSSHPSTNRSMSVANSHLSSASSISRASDGAGSGFYSPTVSEFGRGPAPSGGKPGVEESLVRHYDMLKIFLAVYLRDEQGNTRPTRARDKLLRLSATQFHELSTDVYDELLRREDDRKRPGGGVPPSLPPKQTFHPKRNQARQKLSTLPPDRFRQLATDVFYELERRMPRLTSGDMDRPGSSASGRAPSRQGGMRGPPPNGYPRGPGTPGRRPSGPPGPGGYGPQYSPSKEGHIPPRLDSRSRAGSLAQGGPPDMRPMPQTSQSSTIVPNKSTMVEDDETDEEEDEALGLEKALDAKRSTGASAAESERMREYETEVAELKERVHELQERLDGTEAAAEESKQRAETLAKEKDEWTQAKADLDTRLMASQQSLDNLHEELEQSHTDRSQAESDLRAHTERSISDLQVELEEARREVEHLREEQATQQESAKQQQHSRKSSDDSTQQSTLELRQELAAQRALTEEVRRNAEQFLQEMRLLSEQSELALEKEEQLRNQITSLEQETEHWKSRYTKARTQIRSLRASTIGLGLQHEADDMLKKRHGDADGPRAQALMREDGLVRDVDVSAYQVSVDELVYAARDHADLELPLEKVKSVIRAVKAMVVDIDGDLTSIHSPSASSPVGTSHNGRGSSMAASTTGGTNTHPTALKAKITRDANRLVTATRTHATSHGLAPLSHLDAAAANLTASVIALLTIVGIRPSSPDDLKHGSLDVAPLHNKNASLSSSSALKRNIDQHQNDYSSSRQDHEYDGYRRDNDDRSDGNPYSDAGIAPLQLHSRAFGDNPSHHQGEPPVHQSANDANETRPSTAALAAAVQTPPTKATVPEPPVPHYDDYSDAGMESPIIKGGFQIRQAPPPTSGQTEAAGGAGATSDAQKNGGGGIGGWFNMLKSPSISHKSMDSDDDDYV